MMLWVVMGNDRDHDEGGEWVVGIFSTAEKAMEAIAADRIKYAAKHGISIEYANDIYDAKACDLDEVW
jgi:hypothetical protein